MCGKACSVGVECQEPEKKDLGPTVVMMHVCIDDNVCSLILNARRVRKKRSGTHCSVVMMRVCIDDNVYSVASSSGIERKGTDQCSPSVVMCV
jgi:hypothetical protein